MVNGVDAHHRRDLADCRREAVGHFRFRLMQTAQNHCVRGDCSDWLRGRGLRCSVTLQQLARGIDAPECSDYVVELRVDRRVVIEK